MKPTSSPVQLTSPAGRTTEQNQSNATYLPQFELAGSFHINVPGFSCADRALARAVSAANRCWAASVQQLEANQRIEMGSWSPLRQMTNPHRDAQKAGNPGR